jgi:uncharacterized membrane protein
MPLIGMQVVVVVVVVSVSGFVWLFLAQYYLSEGRVEWGVGWWLV